MLRKVQIYARMVSLIHEMLFYTDNYVSKLICKLTFSYTIITSLKQSNTLFPTLHIINKKCKLKTPIIFIQCYFWPIVQLFSSVISLFTFNFGKYKMDRGYISLVFRCLYIHKAELAQSKHCMTYTHLAYRLLHLHTRKDF